MSNWLQSLKKWWRKRNPPKHYDISSTGAVRINTEGWRQIRKQIEEERRPDQSRAEHIKDNKIRQDTVG
jgi:hypothetical protein